MCEGEGAPDAAGVLKDVVVVVFVVVDGVVFAVDVL